MTDLAFVDLPVRSWFWSRCRDGIPDSSWFTGNRGEWRAKDDRACQESCHQVHQGEQLDSCCPHDRRRVSLTCRSSFADPNQTTSRTSPLPTLRRRKTRKANEPSVRVCRSSLNGLALSSENRGAHQARLAAARRGRNVAQDPAKQGPLAASWLVCMSAVEERTTDAFLQLLCRERTLSRRASQELQLRRVSRQRGGSLPHWNVVVAGAGSQETLRNGQALRLLERSPHPVHPGRIRHLTPGYDHLH